MLYEIRVMVEEEKITVVFGGLKIATIYSEYFIDKVKLREFVIKLVEEIVKLLRKEVMGE